MPGIVTHSRVLRESISCLSKREKKSYLHRSIETLFHTPDNITAALFGAIGPNIFDYIPNFKKNSPYGNGISFFLHDGGINKLLHAMIMRINSYTDKNNEWAATQRSFLYGFISHIITDSVFNPYIYYYSGFPKGSTSIEYNFFREQNLLFKYNIDNYFQYHEEKNKDFPFQLVQMLPVRKKLSLQILNNSIKTFLLDSIKSTYPDIYQKIVFFEKKHDDLKNTGVISSLDILPYCIRTVYRLKRSNNPRLADFFRYLRRNNIIYSDFLIRYPMNRRYNKNILNLHRERWENPAGKIGLHYESIPNLLNLACDKTIESWEKIESSLYSKEKQNLDDYFCYNAFTGDSKLRYKDLKIKNPIRLTN